MPKLAITIGDINGIAPEIIVKMLALHSFPYDYEFSIVGPKGVIKNIEKELDLYIRIPVNFIEPDISTPDITLKYGLPTQISGEIAFKSIEAAIKLAQKAEVDAVITAPLSKKALHLAGYKFSGHTEILQAAYPSQKALMLFVSDKLKLLVLTRHIPLREVAGYLSKDLITDNVSLLVEELKRNFNLTAPKIAICALNPHAGESGTIGNEENDIIIPAVNYLKSRSVNIEGPFSADSFWKHATNYDCVVALYHDQGLIPMKLLGQNQLVNVTIGLPIIRTSPCHGTAFDIAGKHIASEASMVYAVYMASQIIFGLD